MSSLHNFSIFNKLTLAEGELMTASENMAIARDELAIAAEEYESTSALYMAAMRANCLIKRAAVDQLQMNIKNLCEEEIDIDLRVTIVNNSIYETAIKRSIDLTLEEEVEEIDEPLEVLAPATPAPAATQVVEPPAVNKRRRIPLNNRE